MGFNLGKSLSGFSRDLGRRTNETFTEGINRLTSGDFSGREGALGKWDPGKGTFGHWMGQIYGGSTKSIFDTMQGKDSDYKEEDVPPPTLTGSQVDPDAEQGALQDIRKRKEGRLAANLAPASGASILTSR